MAVYHVYMLSCADGTLYTGITTDLERRLKEHNQSKVAAKYTRARRPVALVYSKKFKDRSSASIAEAAMKKLSKEEKLALIAPNV
jgi:putative endonuclease